MKKIFSFTTFFLILFLPGAETQMTVSRQGKNYSIETAFAPGITLVQNLIDKSPEWPVNFTTPYLKLPGKGKVDLAYSHDDAAPWNFNKTYIGGNHGDSAGTQLIFQEGHGLTGKDCGSQWKTPKGRIFYILKVKDPKVLWILSDDLNKEKDLWSFDRVWTPPLVNVKDGRVLDKFKAKVCLLGSPVRINDLRFLADGKELKDNETRRCSKFTVEEEYDIVATDALVEYVKKNPGKNFNFNSRGLDKVLTQKITLEFFPNGSCTITWNVRFFRDVKLGYMGFMQFGTMRKGKYARHTYHIPGSREFIHKNEKWDFSTGEDFTRKIHGSMLLKADGWEDPLRPPERFIQYLSGNGQVPVAFAAGYSLLEGCTRLGERHKNVDTAIFIYRSRKSYPHALDAGKHPRIRKNSTFHAVLFRQFFNPANGCYWNFQKGKILLYADFMKPEQRIVKLPAALAGKRFSVVDQFGDVLCQRKGDTLVFNSRKRSGSIVLRFF